MDIDFGYVKEYVSNFNQVKSDIVEVAKNCFNFSGNLSRPKYLSYSVALWLVSMVVNGVLAPLSSKSMIFGLLMGLVGLAFAVVTIGPLVCRVRDSGKNIWVTLLCIFPGIILCGLPTLYSLYVVVLVGSHNGAPSAPAAQPQDQPPAGN
jgi:uncharacterized membrane protein YhaH (DUF805 family)